MKTEIAHVYGNHCPTCWRIIPCRSAVSAVIVRGGCMSVCSDRGHPTIIWNEMFPSCICLIIAEINQDYVYQLYKIRLSSVSPAQDWAMPSPLPPSIWNLWRSTYRYMTRGIYTSPGCVIILCDQWPCIIHLYGHPLDVITISFWQWQVLDKVYIPLNVIMCSCPWKIALCMPE